MKEKVNNQVLFDKVDPRLQQNAVWYCIEIGSIILQPLLCQQALSASESWLLVYKAKKVAVIASSSLPK